MRPYRLPAIPPSRHLATVKIYTKTGDTGETSLLGAGRVRKSDPRVAAYGDVDELNSALGFAMACDPTDIEAALLTSVQRDLFAIGGQLASPEPEKVSKVLEKANIDADRVATLETAIDRADEELEGLTAFVLPGGTQKAAAFHVARTVCRRAERSVVALQATQSVLPIIVVYLNRLSDLLFTLARLANSRAGIVDRTW